eukprot:g30228.t1
MAEQAISVVPIATKSQRNETEWITWIQPRHQKDNGRNSPVDPAKSSLLTSGGLVPKLGELSHRLVNQQRNIVMFTESYLTDNVPDTTITIPGYVLSHRQDRLSRGGGTMVRSWEGVALGVRNVDTGYHEISWLQVKHGQGNLLLITMYHPP